MTAAITIVPASGDVIAIVSACRISVSGVASNDPSTYDEDAVPTEDPVTYVLKASKSGQDDLVSHEFSTSFAELHVWDNLIFPDDGTWTLDLVDLRDDSVAATASVVVTT